MDTQHNNKQKVTLSIMTLSIMAECSYAELLILCVTYTECHTLALYAECHYAEFCYAQCHSVVFVNSQHFSYV